MRTRAAQLHCHESGGRRDRPKNRQYLISESFGAELALNEGRDPVCQNVTLEAMAEGGAIWGDVATIGCDSTVLGDRSRNVKPVAVLTCLAPYPRASYNSPQQSMPA